MLSADRDYLCDTCELSCGVALAGLFQWPCQKRVFAYRLLGEIGIDAIRPKEEKASDAVGYGAIE